MEDGAYWGRLQRADAVAGMSVLGGCFLISPGYALTAGHCVSSLGTQELVRIVLAGTEGQAERVIGGAVVESLVEQDLALLSVHAPPRQWLSVPPPDKAEKSQRWLSPYQPSAADPCLTGTVRVPKINYQTSGGTAIEAVQLEADQTPLVYDGYSGAPVAAADSSALLGLLVEQVPPDRGDGPPPETGASNVLFAACIAFVMDAFPHLSPASQLAELDDLLPRTSTFARDRDVALARALQRTADVDEILGDAGGEDSPRAMARLTIAMDYLEETSGPYPGDA